MPTKNYYVPNDIMYLMYLLILILRELKGSGESGGIMSGYYFLMTCHACILLKNRFWGPVQFVNLVNPLC